MWLGVIRAPDTVTATVMAGFSGCEHCGRRSMRETILGAGAPLTGVGPNQQVGIPATHITRWDPCLLSVINVLRGHSWPGVDSYLLLSLRSLPSGGPQEPSTQPLPAPLLCFTSGQQTNSGHYE